jgi:hypothetical protein
MSAIDYRWLTKNFARIGLKSSAISIPHTFERDGGVDVFAGSL